MQHALLNWMRTVRRNCALAVVLALLAPMLVAVLPTPALSAEQQLLADLSQNICGHSQSGDQDKRLPADHSQCCVICVASHHVFVAQAPAVASGPLHIVAIANLAHVIYHSVHAPPDMRATAPRGPPAV